MDIMRSFEFIACNPAGWPDPGIAIAASRAQATGLLNIENTDDEEAARLAVGKLVRFGKKDLGGIKVEPPRVFRRLF